MQIRTVCNICGNTRFRRVFRLDGFDVVCCRSCNTYFRNVVFDKAESKELYGKDYFCDLQKDYFFSGKELREKACAGKIAVLDSLRPAKGKLLDIGCGTGYFLDAAQRSGWDIEGVEISQFAADYARTRLNAPVQAADFLDSIVEPESFDVITMWDMIDHSEYPADVLKKACRALKPGGLVAMDTFMIDGLLFKFAEYAYRGSLGIIRYPVRKAYPVHHSHYFSTRTFAALLERNGCDIILRRGTQLEAEVVSLDFWGKKAVSLVNWMTNFCGKKMEMMLVGRKRG